MSTFFDGRTFHLSESDLPCLISGQQGSGASQLHGQLAKRMVVLPSGDSSALREALKALNDIGEWVIVLKNLEVFDRKTYQLIKDHRKLILSGDFDACGYGDEVLSKGVKTAILFSDSRAAAGVKLPRLERYQGFLTSATREGLVSAQV